MIETTSSGPRRATSASKSSGSAAAAAAPRASSSRYDTAGRLDRVIARPATAMLAAGSNSSTKTMSRASGTGTPSGPAAIPPRSARPLDDQHRRLGVPPDEAGLLRRRVRGAGDAHRPGGHQREVDDAPLVPVVAEEGDVLALPDAARAQAEGAGAHLAGELGVGLARETVALAVLLRDAVREAPGAREGDVDERPVRLVWHAFSSRRGRGTSPPSRASGAPAGVHHQSTPPGEACIFRVPPAFFFPGGRHRGRWLIREKRFSWLTHRCRGGHRSATRLDRPTPRDRPGARSAGGDWWRHRPPGSGKPTRSCDTSTPTPSSRSASATSLPSSCARAPSELVHPDDRHLVEKLVRQARERKEGWSRLVLRWRHRDGSWRHIESSGSPLFDGTGSFAGLRGLDQDVTERLAAEQRLRENEERFKALIESTSDWIWEVDEKARYTYASPKVRDLLGYEPREVIGKTPFDFMEPGEAARVAGLLRGLTREGKPLVRLANVNVHRDGRRVILETSGVPIFDAGGAPRVSRHRPGHHRAAPAGGGAAQDAEARVHRHAGRRHRPRLQQPPAGHLRLHLHGEDCPSTAGEAGLEMLEQAEKALHLTVSLTSQLLTFSRGGKPVKKPIALRPGDRERGASSP